MFVPVVVHEDDVRVDSAGVVRAKSVVALKNKNKLFVERGVCFNHNRFGERVEFSGALDVRPHQRYISYQVQQRKVGGISFELTRRRSKW